MMRAPPHAAPWPCPHHNRNRHRPWYDTRARRTRVSVTRLCAPPTRHRYAALKERLGWTNAEFLQYVKIKSLSSQPSDSMVVGVGAMGETAANGR